MIARLVRVPAVDWLTPIDHSASAPSAAANSRAAPVIVSASTPQNRAARSAGQRRALSSISAWPSTWASR
jgi:hypothetical protein